ncbi:arsenite methyltransferase [Candidatus Latescibacterota bacterium]
MNDTPHDSEQTRDAVRDAYSRIAQSGGSCCERSTCCGSGTANTLSEKLGYTGEERAEVPAGADMGLSCGNPFAVESLASGETVLDLGCGGGFDVFIAARKVGPHGRVIGVDMTPDMISRARTNARAFSADTGLSNIEFRLGEIEHLPVADETVDVIISNCVINLSTDKPRVWREIARVLKPGGRLVVSDLALLRPLPEEVRVSIEAYIGCVAGAVLIDETKRMANDTGLVDVSIQSHPEYIDTMTDWSDPLYQQIISCLPSGTTAGEFVTSITLTAVKPS